MKSLNEPHEPEPKITAPSRQQWVKPELVYYGHLAKLTRGPSGMFTEPGGMATKMSCL